MSTSDGKYESQRVIGFWKTVNYFVDELCKDMHPDKRAHLNKALTATFKTLRRLGE